MSGGVSPQALTRTALDPVPQIVFQKLLQENRGGTMNRDLGLLFASMFQHRRLGPVVDRTPARATVTSDGTVGVGGVVSGYPEVHELLLRRESNPGRERRARGLYMSTRQMSGGGGGGDGLG